jgi:hypothetical protein
MATFILASGAGAGPLTTAASFVGSKAAPWHGQSKVFEPAS